MRPTPQAPRQPAQGNPAAMCENEEQKNGTAVCKNEAMESGGDKTRRVIKQPVNRKRNNKEETRGDEQTDNRKQILDLPSVDGFDETMMSFYEEDAQIYMIATAVEKLAESRLQMARSAGNKESLELMGEEDEFMSNEDCGGDDDADQGCPELMMFSPQRENSYFIRSAFNHLTHTLLLDTGCSHSVIPIDVYKSLPEASKQGFNPRLNHGRLADGSGVTIHGVAMVKMKIGSREFLHDFQVAEINGKILLGMDFFRKYRCVLDVHNYRFQLGVHVIECCDVEGHPLIIGVQVPRKTTVPGRSKMLVEARLTRPLNRTTDGIVEPKNRIVGLLIAASLHSPRGMELCVEVMNTTDKDITLSGGSIIGQFVPVDEVLTTVPAAADYEAFRTCQTEEKPPHAQEHLSLIYRCGGSGWQNVKNPGFNFRVTKYHFYQEPNLSS